MTITQKTVYVASDGTEHGSYADAHLHDVLVAHASEDKYIKYIVNTYGGKRLLEKHSLTERGEWEVRGEDENADIGGSHNQQYLGTFSGTLEAVIRHAVNLPGFWAWGGGGDIRKIEVVPVPVVINLD